MWKSKVIRKDNMDISGIKLSKFCPLPAPWVGKKQQVPRAGLCKVYDIRSRPYFH